MSGLSAEKMEEQSLEIVNDPWRMNWLSIICSMTEATPAYPHSFATMVHELEMFADKVPLEDIKAPTLICHGDQDTDIPLS